jgi:UDP:flavonoid glycosyltransferase YjiC (YdhE family)
VSRRRVFLVGPPFSGHLHPLLGIGRRLQREAECEVMIVSTPAGVAAANACGLRGHAILAGR